MTVRAPCNFLVRQSKATPSILPRQPKRAEGCAQSTCGKSVAEQSWLPNSRVSPFWHRPFFLTSITKAWLRPMALGPLQRPTLHPDPSPGVVRAPGFWRELLNVGSWEQLRVYQMPGWWVPSKHTDSSCGSAFLLMCAKPALTILQLLLHWGTYGTLMSRESYGRTVLVECVVTTPSCDWGAQWPFLGCPE